jgi:glycosyltransferase involved in cell wall biosynthesis
MQEIKKRRIVLASVLKPATEPRMFDKIGVSLSKKFDVYCIGAHIPTKGGAKSHTNPSVLELPRVYRLSLSRILAPFNVLAKIIKLRPSLIIICTHELIFISFLAKVLTGCKVIYDVQENYYRNILYGNSFPIYLRPLIAVYVRFKEWMSALFTSHYFLAEKGYEQEMAFFGKERTVLENKAIGPEDIAETKKSKNENHINLLFTGTLAETTGVFIAIDLAKKLHESDNRIHLEIIGYSSKSETLTLIQSKIQHHPFIKLIGGNSIVPHEDILSAIHAADFGIISYPPNPSTINSVPTKLFEYLGYRLPILLIDHPLWVKVCEPYNAAIPFNPEAISATEIVATIKGGKFYTTLPQDVFWSSEEKKVLQMMVGIIG